MTQPFRRLFNWAWGSWAARSLAAGGVATVVDILVGLTVLELLEVFVVGLQPLRAVSIAAMVGVAVGTTVSFLINRYFAFKEHKAKLAAPAVKFLVITGLAMIVHGQLVAFLKVRYGIPFPLAKIAGDLAIFSVGQLFVLRYIVFPKAKPKADP